MSDLIVKRIDSAHMKHMFDMALENSDVDFLTATTHVSLDQVKNLKLDNDARDVAPRKVQPRPPQPPRQPLQKGFSLSTFDALLDNEDANSWLVASDSGDSAFKNKSHVLLESKKDLLGSPIESSVSSEIRNSSVTPASILDRAQTSSKNSFTSESPDFAKSPDRYFFSRPRSACGHDGSLVQEASTGLRDSHRPRSLGSDNRTKAPNTKKKPPRAAANILRPKSSMDRVKPSEDAFIGNSSDASPQKRSRIPRLGTMSKRSGPAASPEAKPKEEGKSVARSLTSLATKCRPFPKSTGTPKQSRLPPLSPSPGPKSSFLKLNKEGVKDVRRASGGAKSTSGVPPSRPTSALRKAR